MSCVDTFLCDVYNRQQAALQRYGVVLGESDAEPVSIEDARAHCRVDTYLDGSPPAIVSDDDAWLTDVGIPAARAYCESVLGRSLSTRDVRLTTSAFPSVSVDSVAGAALPLPFGPVQSVTAVTYLDQTAYQEAYDAAYAAAYDEEFNDSGDEEAADAAGVLAGEAAGDAALEQTMPADEYELDASTTPARLILAHGASWPTGLRMRPDAVRVDYVAGYSVQDDSPQAYVMPRTARAAVLLMLAHLYEHRGDESVSASPVIDILLARVPGREDLGFA